MRTFLITNILLLFLHGGIYAQGIIHLDNIENVDSLALHFEKVAVESPEKAIALSGRIQNKALRNNDSILYAVALNIEGHAQYLMGNINAALALHHEALGIFEKYNNPQGIYRTYLKLAIIDARTANYYQALLKLDKSLRLSRKIQDTIAEAVALYHIGHINYLQNEIDAAWSRASESLELITAKGKPALTIDLYNLMVGISIKGGDLFYAENLLKKIDSMYALNPGNVIESDIYENKALLWSALGNGTKAAEFAREALEISQDVGTPYELAENFLLISAIYRQNGEYQNSIDAAKKAIDLVSGNYKLVLLERNALEELSESYLASGDTSKALSFLRSYKHIDDSLQNFGAKTFVLIPKDDVTPLPQPTVEKDSVPSDKINLPKINITADSRELIILIAVLSLLCILLIIVLFRYIQKKKDVNKNLDAKDKLINDKQQQVDAHQKELEAANQKLEDIDKTKNKVFSVLTHDLRQPINQIKSILSLLEMDQLDDKDRIDIVEKLKESVDNSSNALENLLLWSKKQLTGINTTIVDVHLLPQVWQLESHMKPTLEAKKLKLQINIPDFFKIKADMNQLDICLRNLVTNAIKFSNRGSTITIDALEEKDKKLVRVIDNGVGMTEEEIKKLLSDNENFSTPGTMNEKGTGLGILITREFMANQNGSLEVESHKGQGSIFSLVFPDSGQTAREEMRQSEAVNN